MTLVPARPSRRCPTVAAVIVAVVALAGGMGVAACGGSDDPPLPPLAAQGREIARSSGCSACHGRNGEGGVGPTWSGVYGEPVELEGGETVTADDEYLYRSIADPAVEKVEGYSVVMPNNNLDDDEIAAVIAYIRELR